MSMTYEIEASKRTETGKAFSRRLRRIEDRVPAIVYGTGTDPENITLDHKKISHNLEHEGFYSSILTLKVDSKAQKVVLKDIQRHPSKPKIMHIDFLRIDENAKITMHIPLHFNGEESAPGVKEGGVLAHLMNEVEIQCLPADLPEYIDVDVSKLGMDEVIHLSNLTVPKGVEIVALSHDDDQSIVSIHKPKVEAEPEPAEEAAEGEAAEGEEAAAEGGEEKPAEGEQ